MSTPLSSKFNLVSRLFLKRHTTPMPTKPVIVLPAKISQRRCYSWHVLGSNTSSLCFLELTLIINAAVTHRLCHKQFAWKNDWSWSLSLSLQHSQCSDRGDWRPQNARSKHAPAVHLLDKAAILILHMISLAWNNIDQPRCQSNAQPFQNQVVTT